MLVRKPARQILFILLTAALTLASCNVGGGTAAPTTDLNTISTAAFNTAMAQISGGQTQTALAAPSATVTATNTTNPLTTAAVPAGQTVQPPGGTAVLPTVSFNTTPVTPLAAFTAIGSPVAAAPTTSLGDSCNNSAFEGDITIPDWSVLEAGVNFQKVWALRNTGTCLWDDGYALVFIGGSQAIDPYDYKFSKTKDTDFVAGGESINIGINLTAPCTPGKYEGHWRMRNDKGYYFGTILSVYIEVKEKRKGCGS